MRWWRKTRREEIERELGVHLDLEAEEQQADGLPPREARYAAQRAFGNVGMVRDRTNEVWNGGTMDRLLQDFRFAWRTIRRNPAFASIVIVVLALGIGANSAVFSVIDAVLLKPLPYPQSDRLVSVYEFRTGAKAGTLLAPVRMDEWNASNSTLEHIAGYYFENLTETSGAAPERFSGQRVSPGFFQVLGTPPSIGRWLVPEESRLGGPLAVVISDGVWERRFHRDPSAVGQTLRLGSANYTIVGVMPPSFRFPTAATDVWSPTQWNPAMTRARSARLFQAIGRLK